MAASKTPALLHITSVDREKLIRMSHMDCMQNMNAVEARGKIGLNARWGCFNLCCMNLVWKHKQERRVEVSGVEMGDSVSLISVLDPFSMQCMRCRKPLTSIGGIVSVGNTKLAFANEDGQAMVEEGSDNTPHALHDSYKSVFFGMGKNFPFSSVKEDGGRKGFAQAFDSLPNEVQSYMKDMENQICMLRGENFEFKRVISHLYSLVQATHSEVRRSNNKINGQVSSLAETFDKGCPCSIILDAKILAIHSSVKIVEENIDNMRAQIRQCTLDLNEGIGGSTGGNEGIHADTPH